LGKVSEMGAFPRVETRGSKTRGEALRNFPAMTY